MGLLKNLVRGMGEDRQEIKAKLKEAQQDRRIANIVEEREKSANRREFERYMKEQEEERIKQALDKIRKEKSKEVWKPKKTILDSDTNILANDRPMLKEKNIFKHKKGGFISKGSMFMK